MTTPQSAPAFSIGDAIAFGWEKFKENIGPLLIAALIVVAVNGFFSLYARTIDSAFGYFVWQVLGWIVGSIIAMGWLRVSLRIVDGETFDINDFFPTGEQLVSYVVASILFGIGVGIGLVFFIIPGVYLAITFGFYGFNVIDKGHAALESLQRSAELTRGRKLDLLFFFLALLALNIAGLLVFIVGVLVTAGISLIALGYVYRALQAAARPSGA